MAGVVTPDRLEDVCGDPAGAICEAVLDATGNDRLAELADWLVARPLKIVLIALAAWVVNRLIRRSIARFVYRIEHPGTRDRIRRLRTSTPIALLDTPTEEGQRSVARARTLGVVLRGLASTVVYAVAALMIVAELGVNLGPLIAGAGIAGVAIGFGAQSLVRDFLSGIFILLEDQYGVGDVIDLGDATGTVENVSLRTTRLRALDGTVWHVPNGEIHRVGNMSHHWARAVIDVDVAYDTDLDRATQLVQTVADAAYEDPELGRLIQERPEVQGVQNLGADAVSIRLLVQTEPGEQWGVARALRGRLKKALDAAGIEIPFPQRTVWVRPDERSPA